MTEFERKIAYENKNNAVTNKIFLNDKLISLRYCTQSFNMEAINIIYKSTKLGVTIATVNTSLYMYVTLKLIYHESLYYIVLHLRYM